MDESGRWSEQRGGAQGNVMVRKDDIPDWMQASGFLRRVLQVRHGVLLLMQALGIGGLVAICLFLFGDAKGHSRDEIGPAAPWFEQVWVIAFVVGWNVLVGSMLRHSARLLRQGNGTGTGERGVASGGDPGAGGGPGKDGPEAAKPES
jgi:hypothetical protein